MPRGKQRITTQAVRYCLRNLGDPVALKRSPLCGLPAVEEQARTYRQSPWARAHALRDVLQQVCNEVLALEIADVRGQRVQAFLRLYVERPSVSAAARELDVDRRTIQRYVMPVALELVADGLRAHAA
jgi:hypothetical protein